MTNYIYRVSQSSYNDSLQHFDMSRLNSIRGSVVKAARKLASNASNMISGSGKKMEREWKKHKWVARKRGKDGKWIYDYGKGYPDEAKQTKKKQKISESARAELQGKNRIKERSDKYSRTPKVSPMSDNFMKARISAQNRSYHKGREANSFKDLDYDSNDYVVRNGQRVKKAEDGTAYVQTRNPYKRNYYADTAEEASRLANEDQQKKSHSLKTKRGRQVY